MLLDKAVLLFSLLLVVHGDDHATTAERLLQRLAWTCTPFFSMSGDEPATDKKEMSFWQDAFERGACLTREVSPEASAEFSFATLRRVLKKTSSSATMEQVAPILARIDRPSVSSALRGSEAAVGTLGLDASDEVLFRSLQRSSAGTMAPYVDVVLAGLSATEHAEIAASASSHRWTNAAVEQSRTLILRDVDGRDLSMFRLARSLEERMRPLEVGVSVYFTPAGVPSTVEPHFDTMDVIAVQIEGCKVWHLRRSHPAFHLPVEESPEPLTRRHFYHSTASQEETTGVRVTLHPGDVLYVPRGMIHNTSACAGNAGSLHLSIGLESHAVGGVAEAAVFALHNVPVPTSEDEEAIGGCLGVAEIAAVSLFALKRLPAGVALRRSLPEEMNIDEVVADAVTAVSNWFDVPVSGDPDLLEKAHRRWIRLVLGTVLVEDTLLLSTHLWLPLATRRSTCRQGAAGISREASSTWKESAVPIVTAPEYRQAVGEVILSSIRALRSFTPPLLPPWRSERLKQRSLQRESFALWTAVNTITDDTMPREDL